MSPSDRVRTTRAKLRHLTGQAVRKSPVPVQQLLRRGSDRVLRTLSPASNPDPVWTSPEVPLPAGLTLADVEKSFRSWSVNGEPVGHLDGYVDDSVLRFLHTWGIVRDDKGAALELGANPYFTTQLLDRLHRPRSHAGQLLRRVGRGDRDGVVRAGRRRRPGRGRASVR